MNEQLLPTFFILGAAKAGTTTLYNALKTHPQIYFPKVKEPHFFDIDANYKKGLDYYTKTFFRLAKNYNVRGEATPAYFHLPDIVAPRIAQAYSNYDQPVFILSLRNPVQRAWSHYQHRVRTLLEKETFAQALEKETTRLKERPAEWVGYFSDGLYATLLKKWFKYFDKNQFFIFLIEELSSDQVAISQSILRLIGADTNYVLNFSIKENIGTSPKSVWFMEFLNRPSILKLPLILLLPQLTRRRLKEYLRKKNLNNKANDLQIDETLKNELQQKYNDDILELEKILGRDFSSWQPQRLRNNP